MDFNRIDEGHAEGETELVFHYNRAERIAHAPKIVQDYYNGTMKIGSRGIIKSLFATRGNRYMFFSVVMCAAALMFMWHFGPSKHEDAIAGIPVSLTAFSFEDTVYASLLLDAPTKKYAQGENVSLSAKILFFNTDEQLVQTENFVTNYAGTQQFLRTTCTDYDILTVHAVLDCRGEEKTLSAHVQQQ